MAGARNVAAPRRILILTADYPPRPWSGIGRAVATQAHALARRGHEIQVLHAGRDRQQRTGETSPGSNPSVQALGRRRLPVDARRFDRVHLHSVSLAPLALELRRRFQVPLVYTVHGLVHRERAPGPRSRQASAWQRQLLAESDIVLFLSRAERRAGLEFFPPVARRARVIPNGAEAREIGNRPTDAPRHQRPIVYAGRFALSKGIDRLVQIAHELVPRHRPGLVIAGGHATGTGHDLVRDLCRRFPVACRTVGWLERRPLQELFDRAALVLVPSRYEPFGLVALEAMARGAPVLASDTGGLRDLVRSESGNRRLANPSPRTWARVAGEMLRDPAAGRGGPEFIRRHFEISRIAERLEQDAYGFRADPLQTALQPSGASDRNSAHAA